MRMSAGQCLRDVRDWMTLEEFSVCVAIPPHVISRLERDFYGDPFLSEAGRRWLNQAVLSLDAIVLHRLGYQDYVWGDAVESAVITGADNGVLSERI